MKIDRRSAFMRLRRRWRVRTNRLHFAIKISAPPGAGGDRYGDTAFADDLRQSLHKLGQTAFVDRLGDRSRPNARWIDDVTIVLRGLARVDPVPDTHSYLWIISHPEDVSEDELRAGWRRVYAASLSWGRTRSDPPVRPLLQATSADRFHPSDQHEEPRFDTLFVGTSRRVKRPVVLDAVATGADVAIFGHDWEQFVEPRFIRGEHLPFAGVPAAYRNARRVLNDHWEDMREQGFVSNRLFDAVASGARVVSDDFPGREHLFGGLVKTYSDGEELGRLLSDDSLWPDDKTRARVALQVRTDHSFDTRALELLSAAQADYRSSQRSLVSILVNALYRAACRQRRRG